jgi:hypothetical protein
LPSVRKKALGKEPFADEIFAEGSLPSVTLGKERDFGSVAIKVNQLLSTKHKFKQQKLISTKPFK